MADKKKEKKLYKKRMPQDVKMGTKVEPSKKSYTRKTKHKKLIEPQKNDDVY